MATTQTIFSLAELKALSDNTNVIEGATVYCDEDDKYYMYNASNPDNPITGRWAETTAPSPTPTTDIPMSRGTGVGSVQQLGSTASGDKSRAFGEGTEASGMYSSTDGYATEAKNDCEHAEGKYNKSNTGSTDANKTRSSVGVGTSQENRKNAVEVMADGKIFILGVGNYDGTNPTEGQDVATILDGLANGLEPVYVDSLPAASASTMQKIYFVPSESDPNASDAFMTVRTGTVGAYVYSWQQIGVMTIDSISNNAIDALFN